MKRLLLLLVMAIAITGCNLSAVFQGFYGDDTVLAAAFADAIRSNITVAQALQHLMQYRTNPAGAVANVGAIALAKVA